MSRYKVNRIGFVNFWLYDEEDFYFYDGKLLLRGTNGSGKTVTMQSFFPLIFDGNKSPERLDPFGSRDRKIEDYLLPGDFNGNENTGYLYMEFFNKDENKYLTIGIGIRALRNRGCESWGFAITDNRRIGEDFLLFRERNLRIPLTKKELQTRIGSGGEFTETLKDYKKMVNKLLFGFKNTDLYTEFINLLIQVRSPKLSNSTKPSELTKVLSSVLEPLNEDDLRVMADSIEDMNKYKEKLDDLGVEQKALSNLKNSYQEYNKSILYDKGSNFLELKQKYSNIFKELKNNENEVARLLKETMELKEKLKDLKLEEVKLNDQKNKLEQTDLKSVMKNLEEIEDRIKELETKIQNKNSEREQKQKTLFDKQNELKIKENELDKITKEFEQLISDLTSYEDLIDFDDAKFYLDDLKKERLEFKGMDLYISSLRRRINLLNVLKDISFKIFTKEKEIEEERNKYEMHNDELKKFQKEKKTLSEQLLELSDNFKADIAKTTENNDILKLSESDFNKIYDTINNLERDMFAKIKDVLKLRVYVLRDELQLSISNNNIKINEYENKIDKLKIDLSQIDNILTNNLDDNITKEYFSNNNIKYDYFFNTIDFKENVSDKIKKQIESFLLESGILTSFVINDKIDNMDVKVKCLTEGKTISNNISKYLIALDTPFREKVNKILSSISLSNNDLINISENGKYNFALISGNADSNHELRFIGELSREKYIEREKEKIQIVINGYSKEIVELQNKIVELNKNISVLDNEYNNYIFPIEIDECFKSIDKLELDIKFMNDQISKQTNVITEKLSELKQIEEELNENKKGYYGPVKYEQIKEILDDTNKYMSLVEELSKCHNNYSQKDEFVNHYRNLIEDINYDIDNINAEINESDYNLKIANDKKQTIDEILHSDKYKNVGIEYEKIKKRLDSLKEEIPENEKIITTNEVNSKHINVEIQKLEIELQKKEILKNVAYKIFTDEYNLHYISAEKLSDNEIDKLISSIKLNSSSKDIYDRFNDSLNKYSQYLINYAPKNIYLHNVPINNYLNFTNDDTMKEEIDKMFNDAVRRDLVFNYSGKNVNLFELDLAIDTAITSYQDLISEENRKLFEDLLLNNIGSSIRAKIWASEEWINEVKNLMESMNTSSGLKFSLKWSGVQARTENEMDTSEIVHIFKKGADGLKPEHLTKITNHFKSKIKMKEESLEESERNYLEIIKDVLDYRKWFEFKLFFQRGNSEKHELTDREFNKMSGGEKAIAMYIPLFASIFAKLKSAENLDAPHVIALDEAFAGVDDDNIKDAFRILEELDIDFVLTSQQLWGDYETVKHLAISELHHPIGSNVVSIIKYKWDGIRRSKINDDREYKI